MNLRCLLGHKWSVFSQGTLHSVVNGSCKGEYHILRCDRCGDTKKVMYK